MNVCIPINEERGLASPVCLHFGGTPMFLVVDTEAQSFRVLKNGQGPHEHGQCSPFAMLSGQSVDAVVVAGIGRGAVDALESAGISVYLATHAHAAENLEALRAGRLQKVSSRGTCDHSSDAHGERGEGGCCGH